MTNTTTPEPSPVVRAFGGATVAYECGACRRLFPIPDDSARYLSDLSGRNWARQSASECCGQWTCEKHNGSRLRGTTCDQCWKEKRAAQQQAAFDAATKVSLADYQGEFLYREGFGSEGYFGANQTEVDDLRERGAVLDWAFACDPLVVSESDCDLTDHVAESILSDYHEDAMDWVDEALITQASKLVFEALKDVRSYLPDEGIVVLLNGPTSP